MFSNFIFIQEEEEDPCEKMYTQVNNYLIVKKIGQGSYSKVYQAVDTITGTSYAIKKIDVDGLARTTLGLSHFEREIRLMRELKHKNILELHEVLHDEDTNTIYLIIEYADGGSLASYAEESAFPIVEPNSSQKKPISLATIFSVIKQVSIALGYLHSQGYVHQDIKPANILLTSDGRAIVADFGVGHSFASSDQVIGTPAYQPPEVIPEDDDDSEDCDQNDHNDRTIIAQKRSTIPKPIFVGDDSKSDSELNSESDSESDGREPEKEDVWALGVSLYQTLFGKLPFTGCNIYEIVRKAKEEGLKIPKETCPLVESLLRGMLQIKPSQRFGIKEILQHPAIANASDKFDLPSEKPQANFSSIPPTHITKITAVVCGRTYSFAFRRNRRYSCFTPSLSPIGIKRPFGYQCEIPMRPASIPIGSLL